MKPLPIVSLAGPADLHARAERYNQRVFALMDAEHDLRTAQDWNSSGRFGAGFFTQTKAPVETYTLREHILTSTEELTAERAEIIRLSGGTVKP